MDYPVWYADYEELPQTPYRFSMWQYSSTGSVPGIEGNVDLNIQLLKNKKSIVVILWSAKKYSIIGKRTYVLLKSVRRCSECRSRHAVM